MPLYGSWLQYSGISLVSLKKIETFDTAEMNSVLDEYTQETDDPRIELGVKFREDKLDEVSQIEVCGPYFGVWAVGMSEERGVHTVLHQVETLSEPRLSTTLIQNYTNRDY
jgi:hypothetical protein